MAQFAAVLANPYVPACGCDCEIGLRRTGEDDSTDQLCFCECQLCGPPGQGCQIRCYQVLRVATTIERGLDAQRLIRELNENRVSEEMKREHPLLCGQCRDHALLNIRRTAVLRSRKRRRDDEEHHNEKCHRIDQSATAGA